MSKRVVIMRGIPGSGKSTYIKNNLPGFTVVSADYYFIGDDGVYNFNPSKLSMAHKACMRKFLTAVQLSENVAVDNTATMPEEIAPYYAIAEAMDYDVEIVQIDVTPDVGAARNIHSVPLSSVQHMFIRSMGVKLAPWWKVTHVKGYSISS